MQQKYTKIWKKKKTLFMYGSEFNVRELRIYRYCQCILGFYVLINRYTEIQTGLFIAKPYAS